MVDSESDRQVAEDVAQFVRAVVESATEEHSRMTGGPVQSLDQILPMIYPDLRHLAEVLLRRERREHTLRATGLAHEAYLRLRRETDARVESPRHLLAVAATTMRRILIDYARHRSAVRHGGGMQRVTLAGSLLDDAPEIDLLDLNRVLEELGAEDPRKLQVVELIYFAGYTFEEAGEILGLSARTVVRDWRFAKAWLWRALSGEGPAAD